MPKFSPIGKTLLIVVVLAASALTACSSGRSAPSSGQQTQKITDVLGRTVEVANPAKRILLDGGRLLYTTALLNREDPLAGIVGLPKDLEDNDPDSLQQYRKLFPRIDTIKRTGQVYDGSFSAETAIQLRPDVFVISAANFKAAQDAGIIQRLSKVGIPSVVVDYFDNPLKNTVPSVQIMGKVTGRTAQADAFVTYYRSIVDGVRTRLTKAGEPATPTFLWRAPGYFDCCSSFARSNLAQLVTFAGGDNLADHVLKTPQGTISPETILTRKPAVIIATGADWAPGTPAKAGSFVPLGYDESPQAASSQFAAVISRTPGFTELGAVRNHRAYVVWHHFYDSPYNVLAIQWFAKWLHPDLFADVDPTASIRELHQKFLPIPYQGSFWAAAS